MKSILILCLSLLLLSACDKDEKKKTKLHEADYQNYWCEQQDGETEQVLSDRTRCDCITDSHAIEVDFAKKWAEAIGQSIHYARLTDKKAGILLIMKSKKDQKHYKKLMDNIEFYQLPIQVWTIHKDELSTE
ncbi:MAG: hypothetical protein Q9M28_02980 [Mariprofundaceae bacterium]|nr:hypothetical protein [Mariprofundaceae bacterium]